MPFNGVFCAWPTPLSTFPLRSGSATRQGIATSAVVPQHVRVQRVERGIVDIGLEYALAQVVEHDHARAATQPAEGLLMQLGPGLRAGLEHQEADRLAAVAEGQHEQAHAPVLAAVRVADHGAGAVINLGLFTGRSLDHRAGFLGLGRRAACGRSA